MTKEHAITVEMNVVNGSRPWVCEPDKHYLVINLEEVYATVKRLATSDQGDERETLIRLLNLASHVGETWRITANEYYGRAVSRTPVIHVDCLHRLLMNVADHHQGLFLEFVPAKDGPTAEIRKAYVLVA